MAFPKTHLYPKETQRIAFYAKTIAHPERIAILRLLRDHGPLNVYQIVRASPLSLTTVSQHLRILRRAELVNYEVRAPYIFYRLNAQQCDRAFDTLLRLLDEIVRPGHDRS